MAVTPAQAVDTKPLNVLPFPEGCVWVYRGPYPEQKFVKAHSIPFDREILPYLVDLANAMAGIEERDIYFASLALYWFTGDHALFVNTIILGLTEELSAELQQKCPNMLTAKPHDFRDVISKAMLDAAQFNKGIKLLVSKYTVANAMVFPEVYVDWMFDEDDAMFTVNGHSGIGVWDLTASLMYKEFRGFSTRLTVEQLDLATEEIEARIQQSYEEDGIYHEPVDEYVSEDDSENYHVN